MAKNTAPASTAKDKAASVLADLTLTTLTLPRWSRDRDVVSDRRAKLIDKLNHQKAILAPDYQKPISKRGKPKKEGWYVVQPNGSIVFYCRWGHSQLEFAPAR
jgi:hypothetical protein